MTSTADAIKAALALHRQGNLVGAEPIYRQVLTSEPDNPAALHYLGLIEQAKGNRDLAIDMIRKSVTVKSDQPGAWNNLGGALLERDRIDESIQAFEKALALKTDYAIGWQNLARAFQRAGRVADSIRASEQQLKLQPDNPDALWNIELCRRELAAVDAPKRDHADRPTDGRWFTTIITCFGDYPQYSMRCLNSVVPTPGLLDRSVVRVGCNVVCDPTRRCVREHFDAGRITSLVESNVNLNKGPIVRMSLINSETPYVLVIDDDSHVRPGWLEAVVEFVERFHPFDVAGHIFSIPRDDEFRAMVEARPWWRGADAGHPAYREKVFFATGGFYLARLAFMRQHNYPDRAVRVRREDAMLSDLTNQAGGRLLRFTKDVMDRVTINDGETRGEAMDVPVPTDEDFKRGF
jgi:hypothetical protein